MDNQHRQLTGYQEMDQEKIDLFNRLTALGAQIESIIKEVQNFNERDPVTASVGGIATHPDRWLALARTEFQTGLMYLKRSLAKPTTF